VRIIKNIRGTGGGTVMLERYRNVKKASLFRRFLSGTIHVTVMILVLCIAYGGLTQKRIADNIVRLHIIANSDQAADQELKLKVRDAVLDHMRNELPGGASREEAVAYIQANLPEIQKVAECVLRENGSDEKVVARYGAYPFPTRSYGNITLPAGTYESVRIELGEAKGQNWWCVMFPPLCVADNNTFQIPPEAQEQLQETLGVEGYRLITDVSDAKNTEVQVKFRIVEWVQNSRLKLEELFSSLF